VTMRRTFGLSEGQPRNLVSPQRHLEDWVAAIDHIANTDGLGGKVSRIQELPWWETWFHIRE
jgi:hypothetical protein